MKIKYLNSNLEETESGYIPCVEWVDENGHTYKAYINNMVFSLNFRSLQLTGYLLMLPLNTTEWLKKSDLVLTVDDSTYRNIQTLDIERNPFDETNVLKNNLLTEFDFFIFALGKNIPNMPLNIFSFVIDAIKRKYGL